ncbi:MULTISPECIES: hypothetical protein [unclassified Afipia]|uniref:hypothetical protein n=1 Tax=unclassified Afipia TaxID=2642050 RepID=UPI00126868BC|nr:MULTISPECIES: hypothetical protein [unclassified Afipia]
MPIEFRHPHALAFRRGEHLGRGCSMPGWEGDILQQLQRDQSKAIRLVCIVGQDNKSEIWPTNFRNAAKKSLLAAH